MNAPRDPVLSVVKRVENRSLRAAVKVAKPSLKVPLPLRISMQVRELHQHCNQPVAFVEHKHTFLVHAVRNPNRLQKEGHAASPCSGER